MNKPKFTEYCAYCKKHLKGRKLLFVETEIGRCFCTTECITGYFKPYVEEMHEELLKAGLHDQLDSSPDMNEALFKSQTLAKPDEVWVEAQETGDLYYSFITRFDKFAYLVRCLCLEGQPSYVFLSLPIYKEAILSQYRRGTEILTKGATPFKREQISALESRETNFDPSPLSGVERFYRENRDASDIPVEDFSQFDSCLDFTLDDPDEIWLFNESNLSKWYIFISKFTDESQNLSFEMVVVCELKQSKKTTKLEPLFAFPTIDTNLSQKFRRGISTLHKTLGIGYHPGIAA